MNNLFFRVSNQEKIIFAKHLSIMVKTGMPIVDSLQLLKKQATSKTMKKILAELVDDVSNGQFLSTGLEKFKNVFGELFINVIRVGEASGILYENLNYLAEELQKNQNLNKKIKGALIYPVIIGVSTIGIVGFLTVYIFPKILPVFKSLKITLPITTRALIAVSNFLVAYGFYVVIGLIIFIIFIWLILKIKVVKYSATRFLLVLPLAGRLSKHYNIANFCRTLGLLLRSDIKVVEAITITSTTTANLIYKEQIGKIATGVSRGEEISQFLIGRPDLFPPMVGEMISIGEKTGNLSETLLYLSEFYENDVDDVTKNLSSILEPLLIVVMGVLIGFVALSIITPIYSVTQGLKIK